MGDDNPNAQVEANLLEGQKRYASAGTTLQDIKHDLDSIAAGLQLSWLGPASQDYQDKQGKLTTTVQKASDVLQKGSISIGKMYNSYIEADEKQKEDQQKEKDVQIFMEVFMIFTALLGIICPIIEAADLAFAADIGALEVAADVGGDVATDVTGDTVIADTDIAVDPELGSIDDINDPNAVTSPGNDPSGVTAPVDTVPDDPAPLNEPTSGGTPPENAPVESPTAAEVPNEPAQGPSETPPEETPVEPPETDEGPLNGDGSSEEPTPEASKHDSGVDLSQDQLDVLDKILNGPTVSEAPKEIPLPDEPVQVYMVHTEESSPNEGSGLSMLDTPEVSDPVFSTDPATGDVTLTVHGTDGTITETVIDTAGDSTVTVTNETGGVTVTNTVTKVDQNGITTTVTKADDAGNVTETTTFPNGNTTVKEFDAATGDTVTTDTFTDPDTGDQVVIKSVTDAQGNIRTVKTETTLDTNTAGETTVTEVTTETETDANGHVIEETVTTKKTDPNGNTTVIVHESPDVSMGSPTPTPPSLSPTPDSPAPPSLDPLTPEPSQAGPSQPPEQPQAGPSPTPKRPFNEDPDSPPDPSDPKGKKRKF